MLKVKPLIFASLLKAKSPMLRSVDGKTTVPKKGLYPRTVPAAFSYSPFAAMCRDGFL